MGHETKAQLKDYVEVKIMKIKTTVAALSVLSVLSFGAFAADSIDAAQAQNREAIGTVSVSGVASSPMDMREMLNKKAEEKGVRRGRCAETALPSAFAEYAGGVHRKSGGAQLQKSGAGHPAGADRPAQD